MYYIDTLFLKHIRKVFRNRNNIDKEMIKMIFESKGSAVGFNSFQPLALSWGDRSDIGNVAGVDIVISLGGAGAVSSISSKGNSYDNA